MPDKFGTKPDAESRHWLPIHNDTDDDVPPYGVMRINSFTDNGVFECGYPTEDSNPYGIIFNGPTTLLADGYGQGTVPTHEPYWAHVVICSGSGDDTTECGGSGDETDEPTVDVICGPLAGSFALHTDQTGFRCLSDGDIDDQRAVLVVLDPMAGDFSGSGSGDDGNTYDVTCNDDGTVSVSRT